MSIYTSPQQHASAYSGVANMSDGSGTINPAALNSNVMLAQGAIDPSPRGIKRSRSPDQYEEYGHGGDDDDKPRKRGRPPKTPRTSGDYSGQVDSLPTPSSQTSPNYAPISAASTQRQNTQPITTPTQSSPPRATPKATIKALPTVRDHTSDQLGPENDEYVPREYDDNGEKKVDGLGYLQGSREYKIRTFILPGRGEKLFMLATECARQLQYRDSYLLFNKNRSLYKIIASAKEKEELVNREILPYSYRSRQIAIVTARSMFRQFGSRVIKDGRRVRDDYWEAKAIKQGFTEEDAAGEKRPGATKAREQAALEQISARQPTAYGDVVYSNGPAYNAVQPPPMPAGIVSTMAPLSMMEAYDAKYRDIPRPRQEMTGPTYSDVTRGTTEAELSNQAAHAAEYSKSINQQHQYRHTLVDDYWRRPHEPAETTPPAQPVEAATNDAQQYSSPRYQGEPTTATSSHQQQPSQSTMNPPTYPLQQHPIQSPIRQSSGHPGLAHSSSSSFAPGHPQYSRSQSNLSMSQPSPQMPFGSGNFSPHGMNQPQPQSWGQPPPQPSPAMHRMTTPQFSPNLSHGQIPSPLHSGHPSQSPHPQQMQPQIPMLHHQASSGSLGQPLYGPGGGLQAMNAARFGMGMPQQVMYGMNQQNQFMGQGGYGMQQQQQQQQGQTGPGWQGYQ